MKPLISILIITGTLLSVVFLQMEERRRGYAILKLTREQRQIIEEKRIRSIQLAKIKRPQHIEQFAQNKLTLKKVQANQIIMIAAKENP